MDRTESGRGPSDQPSARTLEDGLIAEIRSLAVVARQATGTDPIEGQAVATTAAQVEPILGGSTTCDPAAPVALYQFTFDGEVTYWNAKVPSGAAPPTGNAIVVSRPAPIQPSPSDTCAMSSFGIQPDPIDLSALGTPVTVSDPLGTTDSATPAGLTVSPMTGTFHPAETIHVIGTGCPPSGPSPVSGPPVGVTLSPSGGGPGWAVSDATISIANTLEYVAGQVHGAATPAVDGSWAVDLVVPADAPPSGRYSIKILCATRLTLEPTGFALAAGSLEEAMLTSGPIAIGAG